MPLGTLNETSTQTVMRASLKQLELSDMKKETRCPATIGFRVGDKDGEVLLARSNTLGVSVHDLARHYTLSALRDREDRAELRDAILKLQKELIELRRDVTTATEALLSSAGKVEAEEAREWVEKTLARKG